MQNRTRSSENFIFSFFAWNCSNEEIKTNALHNPPPPHPLNPQTVRSVAVRWRQRHGHHEQRRDQQLLVQVQLLRCRVGGRDGLCPPVAGARWLQAAHRQAGPQPQVARRDDPRHDRTIYNKGKIETLCY